jgi:uncharacterized protein (DUF2235 family)
MRRLALFFDGTWNTRKSETNVWLMKENIADRSADGIDQLCFYDPGVGTGKSDRLKGGIWGKGLSENIQQGYTWLCERYADGDLIFVFGFSRGAYTARSLVGLVRKAGLLQQPSAGRVKAAYDLYREKDVDPDQPKAVEFRGRYSRPGEVRVHFIGVWDTVGALGVPLSHVPFSRDYYKFHDTELSRIVDYAYHAVAVDEHREDYRPTLWTKTKPENKQVEQRWFIGAHADVGGGYPKGEDALRYIPLRWIQDKAAARGLTFKQVFEPAANSYLAPCHDSFAEFLHGLYRILKFGRLFYRAFNRTVEEVDQTV